jgi:hypothetical protein
MRWRLTLFTFALATIALAQTPTESEWSADEQYLRGQGLPTRDAALLQILRDRTPSQAIIAEFKKHVSHLNAVSYAERMQATKDLVKMGAVVRPLLESLLLDTNAELETVRRLRHVLEHFPADKDFATMSAAARLLQRDKPADGLKVLLDFVPYATDEYVRQEVQKAINAVALVAKKPAPLLVAALKDREGARRAAAIEALVRNLGPAAKEHYEPLLKDAHPLVKYQLGMALVEKRDKTGIPILIEVLASAPPERVDFALDLLYRAAGENSPSEAYAGKNAAGKFQAAWQKWYAAHEAKLDLAKQMARGDLGFTVIATGAKGVNAKNKIYEVDSKNIVRWEFEGPRYPIDLQILSPNRFLIAEYQDRRVTERDTKGAVQWQVAVPSLPIACQRLANGDTFIATRQQLLIVDRDGKNIFTHGPAAGLGNYAAAQRLRNGQFLVVTSGGRCQLLDPQGRELKSVQIGNVYSIGGNVELLPNGRILAPLYNMKTVAEFDWNGSQHWSAQITGRPMSATRLANGNTLITCSLDYRIVEIDPSGKEVWSCATEGRPFRARRR